MEATTLSTEKDPEENGTGQLAIYKQTIKDIRYVFRTYRNSHPAEAWETINKLAHDPRLKMRQPSGKFVD